MSSFLCLVIFLKSPPVGYHWQQKMVDVFDPREEYFVKLLSVSTWFKEASHNEHVEGRRFEYIWRGLIV